LKRSGAGKDELKPEYNDMDILAGALELLGLYLVGRKSKWGFIVFTAGGICWISYSLLTNSTYGLLLICIPAMFVNIGNFFKWKKEEKI
jgi:hypothetical protein